MKRLSKLILAGLLTLVGVGAFGASAYAEGEQTGGVGSNLELAPSAARVELVPGEVLEDNAMNCPKLLDGGCVLRLRNTGDKAFTYRVYASPYSVKGENNELSFTDESGTAYTQISRWISIKGPDGVYAKEAKFTIQPGETQFVHYRISIPEDIPGGSQYAVIWAQIMNSGQTAGIETVGQVGAVISGRSTSNTNEAAEVVDYQFTRFAFSGPLHASATVKNVGNTDFAINTEYTAKTLFGKEIYHDGKALAAYPETEYHVNFEWSEGVPFVGIFKVEFKILAANETWSETRIVVVLPIIILILIILLLTVLIVWIIILVRKRKELKARKLV